MNLFRPAALVAVCISQMIAGASASAADDAMIPEGQLQLLKVFASEFVAITPGEGRFPESFQMGSAAGPAAEQPVHQVTLRRPFQMAKYEVPQNLYEAVMGSNPSRWKGPRNSAEMFTASQVDEFCRRATKLMRTAGLIAEDEEIRLPSEAEWEYCCRAGTATVYSFGDKAQAEGDEGKKASLLDPYGWHTGNAAGNDPPVGALKPNAWGLYDMHGYLWELVQDDWHDSYSEAPADGSPRRTGQAQAARVIRGGSWREPFDRLTSSARRSAAADFKQDDLGFRCVRAKVIEK